MTRDELFAIWAPKGATWTPWVKPVLFAYADHARTTAETAADFSWSSAVVEFEATPPVGHPHRSSARTRDVALIVDLPAGVAVRAGVALLKDGFFPVPVFTALPHSSAIVDMDLAVDALAAGATTRQQASLPRNAPPAFLLDSRRRGEGAVLTPGRYDNRSVVFTTDFPSATSLHRESLRRVVLIHDGEPSVDLLNVLIEWQRGGVTIYSKDVGEIGPPEKLLVRPPSIFGRVGQWFARRALRRGADGTFGALIEQPRASG